MKETRISGEAIILLMLTPYIYFVTYLTEIGYCNYFDIPAELITLSPGNISSIAAVLGVLYAGIHILDYSLDRLLLFIDRASGHRIPGLDFLGRSNILTGLVLYVAVMLLIDRTDTPTQVLFTIIAVILMTVSLIQTFMANRKNREPSGPPHERQARSFLSNRVFDRKVTMLVLMSALITLPATERGGEYNARHQSSFYRINGDDTMIGVVIYGDKIIAKEFINGQIGTRTIIVTMKDNTSIETIHPINPRVLIRPN